MQIPSWSWNNRPALFSGRDPGGGREYNLPVHMCFVDLEEEYDRVPRAVLSDLKIASLAPLALDLQHSLDWFRS